MKKLSPNIETKKVQSVFFKQVTFDYGKLIKALAKAVGHGTAGKWDELANDATDAAAALGISTDAGELAGSLIERSMTKAIFELIGESLNQEAGDVDNLTPDAVGVSTLSQAFEIDARFLDRPDQIPILQDSQLLVFRWFKQRGFSDASSSALSNRLPAYFVYALNHEWRRNAKTYKPLIDALSTPFSQAGEREWSWTSYSASLQRKISESMLDEPFSLAQLYVPLNATYPEESAKGSEAFEDPVAFTKSPRKVVVDLERQLTSWLKRNDPHDAVRVLSGGPGSGKSSFAKVFAAHVAKAELRKVIFIPLHLIDADKSLEDEVGRFVRDEGILHHNPLDHDSPDSNLFIIFDGLDELASLGKAAAETTRLRFRS
jgi:hypothetical protein